MADSLGFKTRVSERELALLRTILAGSRSLYLVPAAKMRRPEDELLCHKLLQEVQLLHKTKLWQQFQRTRNNAKVASIVEYIERLLPFLRNYAQTAQFEEPGRSVKRYGALSPYNTKLKPLAYP